jgi:hypothetical protein
VKRQGSVGPARGSQTVASWGGVAAPGSNIVTVSQWPSAAAGRRSSGSACSARGTGEIQSSSKKPILSSSS